MATPAAAVDPPELEKAYTEHLGQLVTAPGKGGVPAGGAVQRLAGSPAESS